MPVNSTKRRAAPAQSARVEGERAPRKGATQVAKAFHGVGADTAALGAARWSFDGVVRRVLGFSRAAELEAALPERRAKNRRSAALAAGDVGGPSPAFDALNLFVRSLDDETRGKLRALMQAGREAQALPDAAAVSSRAAEADGMLVPDLFASGTRAFQDLQRGHAVACATEFDLELELGRWENVRERASLDERVWLRFGRELARSRVEEWSCQAVCDSRGQLEKLYLRHGQTAWWSFGALIDRPSSREVLGQRSTRGRSRLVSLSLQAAVARSSRAELRAVHRASIAVSARLGAGSRSRRAGAKVATARSAP